MLDRSALVRRLLGAATHLFIGDSDPVSVHCLACSAGEHASFLASSTGNEPFNSHIMRAFPQRSIKNIRSLRNQYWVPIKHSNNIRKEPFMLPAAMEGFSDEVNDHTLFITWYDFGIAGNPLPIEAQVFQIWYFAMYPDKLEKGEPDSVASAIFGDIAQLKRRDQKFHLKRIVEKSSNDHELLEHPKTDKRSLLLGS